MQREFKRHTFRKPAVMLTAAEEVDLADRRDAGRSALPGSPEHEDGIAATRRLAEMNLGIAFKAAHRYRRVSPKNFDDILGEAMVGLSKAAGDFDQKRGLRFSTLADVYARRSIRDYLSRHTRSVCLSRYATEIMLKLHRGQPLSAGQSGWYERHGPVWDRAFNTESTSDDEEDSGTAGLEDHRPGKYDRDCDPCHEEWVRSRLGKLNQRERDVISRRFGIGMAEETCAAVARDMSLTKERVRQVQNDALHKMRDSVLDSMLPLFGVPICGPGMSRSKAEKTYVRAR